MPTNTIVSLLNDALLPILEMERNGFKVDQQRLSEIQEQEQTKHQELEQELKCLVKGFGYEDFNLNSSKQVSRFLYGLELKPNKKAQWKKFVNENLFDRFDTNKLYAQLNACFKRVDGGALFVDPHPMSANTTEYLSTSIYTLKELIRVNQNHPHHEDLKKFYELSRHEHLINTYIEGVNKRLTAKGYLHTAYNQTVVPTLRLSSSNPNLQNWPRPEKFPIREVVHSRFPNGQICNSDLSQIEIRCDGWYYGDETLKADYANGIDIHGNTAEKVYGKNYTKEQRSATKNTVFQIIYWGSAWSIANQRPNVPIWDQNEVQKIIDAFFARYWKIRLGMEKNLLQVQQTGKLTMPTGLSFVFDRDYYGLKNKVANYPIQHLAAVLMYCVLIRLFQAYKKYRLKSLLIGTVHDSFITDVYPGEEETIKEINEVIMKEEAAKEFENRFGLPFDFPLDGEVVFNQRWSS